MGYLDLGGLTHFWATIKAALRGKQDKLTPDDSITLQDGGIGVKTPLKPLTQAEYDALSDAEKQADTVFLVDEAPWTPVPLSIQEYDTDDGWHVRKWSDGYLEMSLICDISTTYIGNTAGVNLRIFTLTPNSFSFPVPLVNLYDATVAVLNHEMVSTYGFKEITETSATLSRFTGCDASVGGTLKCSMKFLGRWK